MNTEIKKSAKSVSNNSSVQLSAYTIADNCTDITDLQDGIDEILAAIQVYKGKERKVPSFFYHRLLKLENKLKKKQSAKLVALSVTIRIKVDLPVLELAIKQCLSTHISPTKVNIIATIKNMVSEQGRSILQSSVKTSSIQTDINTINYSRVLTELRQEFNL